MLSAILRIYVKPDESEDVTTANIPHVMYYAQKVSKEARAAIQRPSGCVTSVSMGAGRRPRIQFS